MGRSVFFEIVREVLLLLAPIAAPAYAQSGTFVPDALGVLTRAPVGNTRCLLLREPVRELADNALAENISHSEDVSVDEFICSDIGFPIAAESRLRLL